VVAAALVVVAMWAAVSCGSQDGGAGEGERAAAEQRFPDVVDVEVAGGDRAYEFAVTVSSPYDSPSRYADGWRVVAPDGSVLGERALAHDHKDEQPFTRSLAGVEIPDGVETVTVEARDLVHGYGGGTVTVTLPSSAGE